jgi:hypothetical protein
VTQALVVGGELTQPNLIVQPLGLLHPFALGRARPKRATQQGIGINDSGALSQSNSDTTQEQQSQGPSLQDQPDRWEAQPGASLHGN